ncbi:MAG: 3-deoxy-D-manno-octulosonic acid transferase, partial [Rhodobacteraceae bacterium]|nr:3-deoxy-D-manno-octulosonic acid transferase [Paracoccaceae bacterium]
YLADTTGEMRLFYAAFDVTFLAGSLVPVGGHNPMEPAAVGTALILGPMIPNNRLSADALLKAGAAVEIADEQELASTVASLLTNEEKCREMIASARDVVEEERKSLDRIFDALAPLLPPREGSP